MLEIEDYAFTFRLCFFKADYAKNYASILYSLYKEIRENNSLVNLLRLKLFGKNNLQTNTFTQLNRKLTLVKMVEHQPRLLGSRVRFPAGAFAIFSVSAKASLPISLSPFPFLFLSLPLPFPSSSSPFYLRTFRLRFKISLLSGLFITKFSPLFPTKIFIWSSSQIFYCPGQEKKRTINVSWVFTNSILILIMWQCSSPPSEIVLDPIGELFSTRFNGHFCLKIGLGRQTFSCENDKSVRWILLIIWYWRNRIYSLISRRCSDASQFQVAFTPSSAAESNSLIPRYHTVLIHDDHNVRWFLFFLSRVVFLLEKEEKIWLDVHCDISWQWIMSANRRKHKNNRGKSLHVFYIYEKLQRDTFCRRNLRNVAATCKIEIF